MIRNECKYKGQSNLLHLDNSTVCTPLPSIATLQLIPFLNSTFVQEAVWTWANQRLISLVSKCIVAKSLCDSRTEDAARAWTAQQLSYPEIHFKIEPRLAKMVKSGHMTTFQNKDVICRITCSRTIVAIL